MNQPGNFAALVKVKLSLAVTASSLTGYLIGNQNPALNLLLMLAGVFLLACGSAALNQYSERDIDSLMNRTIGRPVPSGKIKPSAALLTSGVLFAAGIIFLVLCGILPAILGVLTMVTYNFIYTPLKRVTHLALLPGALVGAIPPLIGYFSAVTGAPSKEIIAFSGFMFMWQVPHFWFINTRYREDYEAAGLKSIYPRLDYNTVRFLIFTWVSASVIALSLLVGAGLIMTSFNAIIPIVVNVIFLTFFSFFLFSKPLEFSGRVSFILINMFSIIVMILFIAGSLS